MIFHPFSCLQNMPQSRATSPRSYHYNGKTYPHRRMTYLHNNKFITFAAINKNNKKTSKMKKLIILSFIALMGIQVHAQPKVYVTRNISPEGLMAVYKALGVKAKGKVAVKVSTGEAGNPNYLQPSLIGPLVKKVKGTIVECNTAYGGKRSTTEEHLKVAEEHGFTKIAKVDIMDSEGEMKIPVKDTKYIKYDIVGSHLKNYNFMINLAHFKGHPMGGLGGVLKNQSI